MHTIFKAAASTKYEYFVQQSVASSSVKPPEQSGTSFSPATRNLVLAIDLALWSRQGDHIGTVQQQAPTSYGPRGRRIPCWACKRLPDASPDLCMRDAVSLSILTINSWRAHGLANARYQGGQRKRGGVTGSFRSELLWPRRSICRAPSHVDCRVPRWPVRLETPSLTASTSDL